MMAIAKFYARRPATDPVVSVVIPAYRAEEFVEYAMRSVAVQSHRGVELVVVDDCSPDGTGEVAERVAAQLSDSAFSARVLHLPFNHGGAGALKAGFAAASGEFLCWLSADDEFISPEKTRAQLAVMSSGTDLTYDRTYRHGSTPDESTPTARRWCNGWLRVPDQLYLRSPEWRLLALFIGNPINGSSVMIRREVIETLGTFDPVLGNVDQDSDLWMRYCALGADFAVTNQTGVFYRIHPGQTSNLKSEVAIGCAVTRLRVLQALVESGKLGTLLNRAWPVLVFAHPAQFAQFPLVSQALCTLGLESGCGAVPRMLLRILRWALRRRGYWDDRRLDTLMAEATKSARSEEFVRFKRLLSEKGDS